MQLQLQPNSTSWDDFKDFTYLVATQIGIILAAFAEWGGVPHTALYALAIAMSIDTVTGWGKALRLKEFSLGRASWGLIFKLMFLIIPVMVAKILSLAGVQFGGLIATAIVLLSLHEVYSFLGNLYTIKTGIKLPEQDSISKVLLFLRKKMGFLIAKYEKMAELEGRAKAKKKPKEE